MSAIDYILTILILASLYLNWHLIQVCRSAMKARKKALRDAQRLLKRGEEAQEQAIADKRRFLEALGEAFLLIGPSGHIVLANTLAKELFRKKSWKGAKWGPWSATRNCWGMFRKHSIRTAPSPRNSR